ncbi:expressed protein [Phakopsora pachyrhizi]|uniref:Expressed protein n=1 Tax=Phakopsora pachyrhizi TaxID=170000 RepID=A0AAV0B6S7_PHAPC|nr:expressed protein [Phakopsora pachyrhizi]
MLEDKYFVRSLFKTYVLALSHVSYFTRSCIELGILVFRKTLTGPGVYFFPFFFFYNIYIYNMF